MANNILENGQTTYMKAKEEKPITKVAIKGIFLKE